MNLDSLSRRNLLKSAAIAGAGALVLPSATITLAQGSTAEGSDYQFEVVRTEEEWRAILTDEEYRILREMGTEPRRSSELWQEDREGTYHCRGCDLHLYSSNRKTILDIGWVFFFHSEPDSVLTGIDNVEGTEVIQAHCRRCGSHLGHILIVPDGNEDKIMHCINGTSLVFNPA